MDFQIPLTHVNLPLLKSNYQYDDWLDDIGDIVECFYGGELMCNYKPGMIDSIKYWFSFKNEDDFLMFALRYSK